MQDVVIRSYATSDYEQVKSNLDEAGLFDDIWDNEKDLKDKVERNSNSILVAEYKGKIIGSVYTVEDGWGSFIFRLAVRKKYRNKGVGSTLLDEAEQILKSKGIREVCIYVDEKDADLREFYKKRGFSDRLSGSYKVMTKVL